MKRYMLDTNIVSHILKDNPLVLNRLERISMATLCISVITQGEILFGLAKRPEAKNIHLSVKEFLKRVDIMSWDKEVAIIYGITRASMERQGLVIGSLDLLIASHALYLEAILVTNDKILSKIPGLVVEDWTKPIIH